MTLAEYAQARGLTPTTPPAFARSAPFLESFTEVGEIVQGTLPGGVQGLVAHVAIRRKTGSSARTFKDVSYTVVQTAVPESSGFMPTLLYRPKGQRFGNIGTAREMGERPDRRVKLESAWVDEHAYVYVRHDQDDLWVRELFSPTFVDWLAREAPDDFGWELEAGSLTTVTQGHVTDPGRLDDLCEAAGRVAQRLRQEALEDHAAGSAGVTREREAREVADAVAKIEFEAAPVSAAAAAVRYEAVARRESDSWKAGALIGALAAGLGIAFTRSVVGGLILGAIVGLLAFRGFARARSKTYGERAFLAAYASERGLEVVPHREFQSRHATLPLPGLAYGVMRGRIPRTAVEGTILLVSDAANRKEPLDYDVLMIDSEAAPSRPVTPAEAGSFGVGTADGRTWAYRRAPAREERTAAALDTFCEAAVRVLKLVPE